MVLYCDSLARMSDTVKITFRLSYPKNGFGIALGDEFALDDILLLNKTIKLKVFCNLYALSLLTNIFLRVLIYA